MRGHLNVWVCLLAVVCLDASMAHAQQVGAAGLRGKVLDAQGKGVLAHVRLVYLGTGLTRETRADEHGQFAIAQLPAGTADVVIEATGFASQTITGLSFEVGRVVDVTVPLQISRVEERVTVAGSAGTVDVVGSEVGAVISSHEIASLPLNGRNFLELALLVPGNAPAPLFDPTKANAVLVSSAGQLGRGGNVTIDGQDDNDEVVGGPLQNVPQNAVQEFQIATNRYSAELGRSAGSTINVITRAGSDVLHGSASLYARDRRLQSLPATLDDVPGGEPFDRQQYSATLGGPAWRNVFWFGAIEVRNQDGAVIVGSRDHATATISQTLAEAPLDDLLTAVRVDSRLTWGDEVAVRYSGQREDDISASTLDRASGSASQRQKSRNRHHAILGSWRRVLSARAVNEAGTRWCRPVSCCSSLWWP